VGATYSTYITSASKLMLSLNIEGTSMNNIIDAEKHPHPMHTFGQARHSRKNGSKRLIRKKTKKLKKVVNPTVEAKKTKMLTEIDGSTSDSDDSDAGLAGRNNDISHF
jgi:hypothetical protein